MRLTIREIEAAFGLDDVDIPRAEWELYMDVERQDTDSVRPPRPRGSSFVEVADEADRAEELRKVASPAFPSASR